MKLRFKEKEIINLIRNSNLGSMVILLVLLSVQVARYQ